MREYKVNRVNTRKIEGIQGKTGNAREKQTIQGKNREYKRKTGNTKGKTGNTREIKGLRYQTTVRKRWVEIR